MQCVPACRVLLKYCLSIARGNVDFSKKTCLDGTKIELDIKYGPHKIYVGKSETTNDHCIAYGDFSITNMLNKRESLLIKIEKRPPEASMN